MASLVIEKATTKFEPNIKKLYKIKKNVILSLDPMYVYYFYLFDLLLCNNHQSTKLL